MNTSVMFSTPALVLTLGANLLPSMAETERIYFQSDDRRRAITRFLALDLHTRRNTAEWVPLDEASKGKNNPCSWREAFEQARNFIEPLKSGIRSVLHDLRAHEKLIEVGLGDKTALPLDVYLIADLSEADAAALLTVMTAIQSLLEATPYAALHVLLNIAVFDETSVSQAHAHVSLKRLRDQLQSLGPFQLPQIYLFDRYKEGVWEAQNDLEVKTILGNFLLALLSGGLAQRIAHQFTQADKAGDQAYFYGASAAIMVLDIEQLQKTCALRLGREIVENEFHSKVDPNPGTLEELISAFLAEYANSNLWKEFLCRGAPLHINPGGQGLTLHISDLQFEDLPIEEWVEAIQAYDKTFKTTRLPLRWEAVKNNSISLKQDLGKIVTEFAQSLPGLTRLYPGGVRAARMILEKTRRAMLNASHRPTEESQIEEEWSDSIQTSLQWLAEAIRKLPKPPRWTSQLPNFLKQPCIQLFNLIYLHRDLKTVTDLREASLRLLEKKFAAMMDAKLDETLAELIKYGLAVLDKQARSLKRLQSMLDKLPDDLRRRENEVVSAASPFRFSALSESLLAWAYYNGKRPFSGFRQTLLTEKRFLDNWQKKNRNDLVEQLMEFCQEVYCNLSEIDLEEVLSHSNSKVVSDLAVGLSQGAIPLLRPNFDQTGGGSSYQMRFFLSRDPRSSFILPLIMNDMLEWRGISTGDPYLVICCRVHALFPIASLSHIFERGRNSYDELDDETKKQYYLSEGK